MVGATWTSYLPEFLSKIDHAVDDVRFGVGLLAHDSIVNGSVVTGAPGQPEDLSGSEWTIVETGPDTTTIGTADSSAPAVETGISHFNGHPIHLHSNRGGFHSVFLTLQNAQPLVDKIVTLVGKRG